MSRMPKGRVIFDPLKKPEFVKETQAKYATFKDAWEEALDDMAKDIQKDIEKIIFPVRTDNDVSLEGTGFSVLTEAPTSYINTTWEKET